MAINRRSFLRTGLGAGLSVSLRAALLGLPSSFLLSGSVLAANQGSKFTIVSVSGGGESLNVNGPGSYPKNEDDIVKSIEHPSEKVTGLGITETINGTKLDVRDLENSADVILGKQSVKASRAFATLDSEFLSNMACFFHNTQANAHAELPSVLNARGALKQMSGRGSEQLPSALAQELAPLLGTLIDKPVVLHGRLDYNGAPLNTYKPTILKSMMAGDSGFGIVPENFAVLYDWSINAMYKDLKTNGTPQQKRFLDEHLQSREQAADLGGELNVLFEGIGDDKQGSQLRTALALIKLKIAPVIAIHHSYSGDNHSDSLLENETRETFNAIKSLDTYWKLLQEHNLVDEVLYATVDVFGRTPKRNRAGGRDHYSAFTNSIVHGTHVNGGIVGGLELKGRRDDIHATGINSLTGGAAAADIAADNTLAALCKTIMAAAGVPEDRLNTRVPDGTVVKSVVG